MIANISGLEQAIVDLKAALQTAVTPYMRTKLCELWSTNGENRTIISTHSKSSFSDAHISGAKEGAPLKIPQMVQDDQRLLMHTS